MWSHRGIRRSRNAFISIKIFHVCEDVAVVVGMCCLLITFTSMEGALVVGGVC